MADAGVVVVGALGRMGEHVRRAVADAPDLRVCGLIEAPGHPRLGEEIEPGLALSDDPKRELAGAAVAIDFSVPESTLANLRAAADAGVAYVTGTTGFDAAGEREIAALAERVPVIHAANFSLSVNLLRWLVREAARRLGEGYDAEIVEIHHAAKRDAPSGTALALARAIAEGRGEDFDPQRLDLGRAGDTGARREGVIGVQALRGGDNPGEHTVMLVGRGERLELTHRAATREHFARGAVRAARWLAGRPPALYDVADALGLEG